MDMASREVGAVSGGASILWLSVGRRWTVLTELTVFIAQPDGLLDGVGDCHPRSIKCDASLLGSM